LCGILPTLTKDYTACYLGPTHLALLRCVLRAVAMVCCTVPRLAAAATVQEWVASGVRGGGGDSHPPHTLGGRPGMRPGPSLTPLDPLDLSLPLEPLVGFLLAYFQPQPAAEATLRRSCLQDR
jgi:hypothetical protein